MLRRSLIIIFMSLELMLKCSEFIARRLLAISPPAQRSSGLQRASFVFFIITSGRLRSRLASPSSWRCFAHDKTTHVEDINTLKF